jgi:hypothetical protein
MGADHDPMGADHDPFDGRAAAPGPFPYRPSAVCDPDQAHNLEEATFQGGPSRVCLSCSGSDLYHAGDSHSLKVPESLGGAALVEPVPENPWAR